MIFLLEIPEPVFLLGKYQRSLDLRAQINRHLKDNPQAGTHDGLEVPRNKFTPIKLEALAANSASSS